MESYLSSIISSHRSSVKDTERERERETARETAVGGRVPVSISFPSRPLPVELEPIHRAMIGNAREIDEIYLEFHIISTYVSYREFSLLLLESFIDLKNTKKSYIKRVREA